MKVKTVRTITPVIFGNSMPTTHLADSNYVIVWSSKDAIMLVQDRRSQLVRAIPATKISSFEPLEIPEILTKYEDKK